MPNTFTQIHIHAVFAVKKRASLIKDDWKDELYKYTTGIVQHYNHKLLAINGMSDHIHIYMGMRPTQSVSDLMNDIKSGTSKWINQNRLSSQRFEWQEGYGAFSFSKSDSSNVIAYIENQELHHRKISFLEEYKNMLHQFEVDFDEKYIFKPLCN